MVDIDVLVSLVDEVDNIFLTDVVVEFGESKSSLKCWFYKELRECPERKEWVEAHYFERKALRPLGEEVVAIRPMKSRYVCKRKYDKDGEVKSTRDTDNGLVSMGPMLLPKKGFTVR